MYKKQRKSINTCSACVCLIFKPKIQMMKFLIFKENNSNECKPFFQGSTSVFKKTKCVNK